LKKILSAIILGFLIILPQKNSLRGEPWDYENIPGLNSDIIAKIRIADLMFAELKFEPSLHIYQSIITNYPLRDSLYFRFINNLAECHYWQHDGFNAENIIRENLQPAIEQLGPFHPQVGNLYLNLGIVNFISNTPAMTEEYFQKALQVSILNFGLFHPNTANVYEWLGAYHESFNDKIPCYYYLNQARSIRRKIQGADNLEMGNVFRYLALFHKRYARHDSAMFFLRKALSVFDRKYGKNNFQSVKCLNNMCKITEEAGKYQEALVLYNEAMNRIVKAEGEIKMATVMTWFNLSDFYAKQGDYINALKTIQKTYPSFFPGYEESDYFKNPLNIGDARNNYLKLVSTVKSEYLKKEYEKDPVHRQAFLRVALQCDSLVAAYLFLQKIRMVNLENLLAFEQTCSNQYYYYAKSALEMYSIEPMKKYISAALSYFERYRDMQFNQRMRRQETLMTDFKDQSFHKESSKLRNEINELNSKLIQIDVPDLQNTISSQIIDKKIALDQLYYKSFLKKTIENEGLIKDIFIDVQDIQNKLPKNGAVYYFSEFYPDYIFIPAEFATLVITKDKVNWKFLKGEELYSNITAFTELLKSPHTSVRSIDSIGFLVYGQLFEPFAKSVLNKSEWIIVPSPDTWLLPFEAICITENNEERTLNRYLLSKYVIHKEYSLLSWLSDKKQNLSGDIRLLAVAPKFNKNLKNKLSLATRRDTALIDLPGARKECEKISTMFSSTLIEGYDATKTRFISLAPDYDIIHISTHGIPSEGDRQQMTLAFNNTSDSSYTEGNMNLYEILNLRLKTQLVSLSACKSAVGIKNKSVGNLNLAWAFQNAGARSVIVSNWDANDFTSSIIMPRFYYYLSRGDPKPQALRKAKIDFLKRSDKILQHPYYWAGFDFIGDGSPVVTQSKSASLLYFYLLFLFVGIFWGIAFLLRERQQKKSNSFMFLDWFL